MRLGLMIVATAVLLGQIAVALSRAEPAQASVIDLADLQRSVRIVGEPGALTGQSVAGAGDVNADGVPDVIVGAPFSDANEQTDQGSAFVVYGGQGPGPIDLHNLGARGFRIDGAAGRDSAGFAVAGAGDMNGDGIDDVVVGAPNASFTAGAVYVIYGQATPDPGDVDLANLGTRGFRFLGGHGSLIGEGDFVGWSVAAAGDVNDDGIADIVAGAPGLDGPNGALHQGAAYVIYGRNLADLPDFNAFELDSKAMEITGAGAEGRAGESVAEADVNGDGVGDVILGAPGAGNNGRPDSGSAYVVFGQRTADPADVDLASPGGRGFRIDGQGSGDAAGGAVAGADLNGDGAADVVVGARLASNNGRANSGSTFVVFGTRPPNPPDVDLRSLGAGGFRIDGAVAGDEAGLSVAAAGDLNGDGIDDVIVGAPDASAAARTNSGEAFVVQGRRAADPRDIDLAFRGDAVLQLEGPAGEIFAASLGVSDDLNGDGHPDLVVGATGVETAYLIDATGPDTTIDAGPPARTDDTTPTFSFHASEAETTFRCSIDQGTPSFFPCGRGGSSHTSIAPLADGTYTFRVAAVDASLNPDPTPATETFSVDTSGEDAAPPQTTITRHPRRTLKLRPHRRRARATFGFTSSEPGSTFRCSLDGRRPVPCHSPKLYRLGVGSHVFTVAATDAVGNRDASPAVFRLGVRRAGRRRP
ncbi:MAG TPA: hypothetical protein VHQ97_10565 [Solirubrobacterales bacterium]|nr:hypothetical protein [Solirubrobacterales bacterium]